MTLKTRDDRRNLAIMAHVDHGKTSLVDAMLWQSDFVRDGGTLTPERLMLSDPERQKSVSIMPKHVSLEYERTRINLLDTRHADFGGEIERTVKMVEGLLLLVDACEGPPPQIRFVLRMGLEAGLAPIVVITKVDLEGARPREVLQEIRDLFVDLDAKPKQLEFPVLYCDARRGICRRQPDAADEPLTALFDQVLETVPAPKFDPGGPTQFLVTSLDYDDYLGRLAMGRMYNGELTGGSAKSHCRLDGSSADALVGGLFSYQGRQRVEVSSAGPGDIVAVGGLESVRIGDSLSDLDRPTPVPPIRVDEPTLALVLSVNDSPTAGMDGEMVGGGQLRERLWGELVTNESIRVDETESPHAFRVCGRSELQLAILIEMMRREGFEMLVGPPQILTRRSESGTEEPVELLVTDCPEPTIGVVTEKVAARRGRMTQMVNHGTGRVRMAFRIPSRGLIGFRTEFLNDTRGTGILNHTFDGYDEWQGEISNRSTGSLVADRPGRATGYAIGHLQSRGTIFVSPGDEVYEGAIVGENSRPDDLDVNITKEKRKDEMVDAAPEPSIGLIPPRSMSLEQALEFVRDDELVEVTPRALRLRKKVLQASRRST